MEECSPMRSVDLKIFFWLAKIPVYEEILQPVRLYLPQSIAHKIDHNQYQFWLTEFTYFSWLIPTAVTGDKSLEVFLMYCNTHTK